MISQEPITQKLFRARYEDQYFSISAAEDEHVLYYKIKGYPRFSEMIRHGHDVLYRIVRGPRGRSFIHLIADLTEAKILLTRDIRFIGAVSYPRLAKAGVRNLAILLTDDFHVQLNVQKTVEFMGPGVFQQVGRYPSLEPAMHWLQGCS